jgi:DNA-binding transcriptional ArsR family regulator
MARGGIRAPLLVSTFFSSILTEGESDMNHLNGMMIARSPAFGREAYKILWYLTEQLEFDNFAVLNIGEISSDLGLKSQAVSRALRTLIDGGVVERGPRVGQRSSFRFVPAAAPYSQRRDLKIEQSSAMT